jgi:hypothetical protein
MQEQNMSIKDALNQLAKGIQGISYAHILFLHWWPREKVQHYCPT